MNKLPATLLGVGLAVALISATEASAQVRNKLAVEATPFYGTISRIPSSADGLGIDLGFGSAQGNVFEESHRRSSDQVAHVGLFRRFATGKNLEFDAGVRVGLLDTRDPFAGLTGGLFYSVGNFGFGARGLAGYAYSRSATAVSWEFPSPC